MNIDELENKLLLAQASILFLMKVRISTILVFTTATVYAKPIITHNLIRKIFPVLVNCISTNSKSIFRMKTVVIIEGYINVKEKVRRIELIASETYEPVGCMHPVGSDEIRFSRTHFRRRHK